MSNKYNKLVRSSAVVILCTLILSCASTSGLDTASSEEKLRTIMSWWYGDYDNSQQLSRLEQEGKPIWRADDTGEGGHIEVTSHYRPVNLPAFGENVIYVEETKHGDPDLIFRQRIYTLSVDEALDTVRVKLWYFNDKEKYVGAWKNLTMLDDLTPEAMFPLQDGCDLIAKVEGDKIHMPMPAKDCVFGERYFNYQVLLGSDSFWFRDRIMNVADDTAAESAGNFTYHELDIIR